MSLRNYTSKNAEQKKATEPLPSLYEDVQKNSIFAFDNPENKKKHPWIAAVETFGINAAVQSFDRFVLNADFAQINFKTIRHNIKTGFVWDNDQFSTNLFAHPYHGGLYFNAARSNGLTFWALNMGQWLSIPFVIIGVYFMCFYGKKASK